MAYMRESWHSIALEGQSPSRSPKTSQSRPDKGRPRTNAWYNICRPEQVAKKAHSLSCCAILLTQYRRPEKSNLARKMARPGVSRKKDSHNSATAPTPEVLGIWRISHSKKQRSKGMTWASRKKAHLFNVYRSVEQWQFIALITRRSWVQVPPLQPFAYVV